MLVFAVVAVGAGRYARQSDNLAPAECLARRATFLTHGLVVLFAVQSAIFTDGVFQHQLEYASDVEAALTVDLDCGRGATLIVVADGIFRFREQQVETIMTPRTVVFALPREITIDEALERHPSPPFSRIPVYGDSRDDVRAFVLRTDLLSGKLAGQGARRLGEISRESGVPCSLQPILSSPGSPDAAESIDAMGAESRDGGRKWSTPVATPLRATRSST